MYEPFDPSALALVRPVLAELGIPLEIVGSVEIRRQYNSPRYLLHVALATRGGADDDPAGDVQTIVDVFRRYEPTSRYEAEFSNGVRHTRQHGPVDVQLWCGTMVGSELDLQLGFPAPRPSVVSDEVPADNSEERYIMDITDRDIKALRSEARAAGDYVQVVVCDVALDEVEVTEENDDGEGYPDYSGGGHSDRDLAAIRRWLRASQDDARAECARVVTAGRG